MMNIGTIIREHRKKSGLTQSELAKMAGVGKTAVFDVERGKQTVQLNTLLKIIRVLNIKIVLTSSLMKANEVSQ
jgi:y4mF family transcriptional regulator